MSEKVIVERKVIIWTGVIYTMDKEETVDSVMEKYNDGILIFEVENFTKITDLEGKTLKEITI